MFQILDPIVPQSRSTEYCPIHLHESLDAASVKEYCEFPRSHEFTKEKFAYCAYRRLWGCTACEDPLQQKGLGTNTDGRTSSSALRWVYETWRDDFKLFSLVNNLLNIFREKLLQNYWEKNLLFLKFKHLILHYV